MIFHVLNRSVLRRTLFDNNADYLAFQRVMEETLRTRLMRICAYCLKPNHWHLILWPESDDDSAAPMKQLTNKHVKRWKEHRRLKFVEECKGLWKMARVFDRTLW